jgi:16S rRNA (cytosine967-C5)-methyltransferase
MLLLSGSGRDLGLEGADRAMAHRLHREVLVWRTRLDRALVRFSSRPLCDLDPSILAALRIGAVQILILGTPAHAAVSATVGALGGHSASGLVNAVLRKLAHEGEPPFDPGIESPHEFWSHPAQLVDRWTGRYGPEDTLRLMEWDNSPPPLGGCFSEGGGGLEHGRYIDDFRILPRTGADPTAELHGRIYLQDEGTVVAARAAAALAAGGTVLEIGAAPGGKTLHLDAEAGIVVSLDSSPQRMERWVENAARMELSRSVPVAAAGDRLPFSVRFDLVFVDAPCTNTGVYRRRPDARWRWSAELLRSCSELQGRLLESAAESVAPGGILFYSTCSLEPEENALRAAWFEERFPGFSRVSPPAPAPLVADDLISIFPPEHGIDGIFAVAWRRAH